MEEGIITQAKKIMINMSASLKELDICKFQALKIWNTPLKQTWNDSHVMNEQNTPCDEGK